MKFGEERARKKKKGERELRRRQAGRKKMLYFT